MNIYEKLNLVQSQLKAPKGQYNSFGGFKYRSLEDIVEAVKPLLINYRLCLTISDSVKLIGDRFYIEATATLINVDKPEEKITTTALAREAVSKKGMDESQISGASSSYARKYALNALFSIDDTKDADFPMQHQYNNNGKSQTQSQMQYTGNTSSSAAINNFQPPRRHLQLNRLITTHQLTQFRLRLILISSTSNSNNQTMMMGVYQVSNTSLF